MTTTTSDEASVCPEGWSENEKSCYWVVFDEVDWVEAKNGCHQLHPAAHLASSGSASENDFIANLYTSTTTFYLWLGGTDSEVEGTWAWTDGTPFGYTDWKSGEGADGTGQNCLAIDSYSGYFSQWSDFGCFDLFPYICEINLNL